MIPPALCNALSWCTPEQSFRMSKLGIDLGIINSPAPRTFCSCPLGSSHQSKLLYPHLYFFYTFFSVSLFSLELTGLCTLLIQSWKLISWSIRTILGLFPLRLKIKFPEAGASNFGYIHQVRREWRKTSLREWCLQKIILPLDERLERMTSEVFSRS